MRVLRRRRRKDVLDARSAFRHFPQLVPFVRPHWKLATGSVSIIGASVLIGLAAPWPLAFVIDSVIGDKPLPAAIDSLLGGLGTYSVLVVIVAAGLVLTALSYGLGIVDNYINTKLNLRLTLDFRSKLYEHVQRLSPGFHDRVPAGQVMYRLNQQANAVGSIVVGLPPLAQSLLTIVGMCTIVVFLDWQLALISVAVVPLIVYAAQYYIRRIEPQLYDVRNLEARAQSTMYEAVSMLRVVLAFGRERDEHGRWRRQAVASNDARLRLTVRQTVFSLVVGTITATGTALVLGFGAVTVLQGDLTVGELTVFLGYVAAMYQPLQQMSSALANLQQQFVNFDTALELLRVPLDIEDAPDAIQARNVRGAITFENVAFDYSAMPVVTTEATGDDDDFGRAVTKRAAGRASINREFFEDPIIVALCARARELGIGVDEMVSGRGRAALTDVSFDVPPGQHVAVVGPTGAGKTTLMNLLDRFYDPVRGTIRIDGVDIRHFTVASLRAQISVVLQEPMLFAGTIGENIRYARSDATHEEMVAAASAANVHDFIQSLPEEYETVIGERGSQLSGGECQRISVARAFLKDAPILLLDEPTSSIDSRTEAVVLTALERLMADRTTFTVAHRLSTVRKADLILVLDQGRVVAAGDHASLLADGGLYAQLYQTQSGARSSEALAAGAGRSGPSCLPLMFRVFGTLLVAAVADLLETGSATSLGGLIARLPSRLRTPPWWLLIGAVFAALRDDADMPLRRLARNREHSDRNEQVIGHLAAYLLERRDAFGGIHERLASAGVHRPKHPLALDAPLSAPWAELEAAYPEASQVLGDIRPGRSRRSISTNSVR